MMLVWRLVSLFLLLQVHSVRGKWAQDRFAISFWVDPIVPVADFEMRYKEIAEANFSVLLGGFGATTRDEVTAQLKAAADAGLKAIPSACGNPGAAINLTSPSLWGFQMKDEPQTQDFAELATWSEAIAQAAPQALRFINLLPNYADASTQLNASSYRAYASEFVKTVKPDL